MFVLVPKAIYLSGCHCSSLTALPTPTSGRPKSTQARAIILSPSPSTSAPPSCPRWVCTIFCSTSRPSRANAPTRWGRLCCSLTHGWKVVHKHSRYYNGQSTLMQYRFSDDPVYMPLDVQRDEYIKNDYGLVYMGSHQNISRRPWLYGQVRRQLFRHNRSKWSTS